MEDLLPFFGKRRTRKKNDLDFKKYAILFINNIVKTKGDPTKLVHLPWSEQRNYFLKNSKLLRNRNHL